MANHHRHQHEKRIDHFSHKHPLTLIEIEEDEKESKSEYNNRSSLRCYGCTEKIISGVPFYQCKEDCPLLFLHHACAHLPTTIRRWHSFNVCDRDLQLTKRPNKDSEYCTVCYKGWYRFAYVCFDCGLGVDMRCATRGPDPSKYSNLSGFSIFHGLALICLH